MIISDILFTACNAVAFEPHAELCFRQVLYARLYFRSITYKTNSGNYTLTLN